MYGSYPRMKAYNRSAFQIRIMRPRSLGSRMALRVAFLMLFQSGCAARDRAAECKPPDPTLDMVALPITSVCKEKMARLACQLAGCEHQWSWNNVYTRRPPDVDRVIADLRLQPPGKLWSERVSWMSVGEACENVKKYCFLGLEKDTDFAAMQCKL